VIVTFDSLLEETFLTAPRFNLELKLWTFLKTWKQADMYVYLEHLVPRQGIDTSKHRGKASAFMLKIALLFTRCIFFFFGAETEYLNNTKLLVFLMKTFCVFLW